MAMTPDAVERTHLMLPDCSARLLRKSVDGP